MSLTMSYSSRYSKVLLEAGFVFMIIALLVRSKLRKLRIPVINRKNYYPNESIFEYDIGTRESHTRIPVQSVDHKMSRKNYGTIV